MKKQQISGIWMALLLTFVGTSIYAQDTIPIQTLPPVTVTATKKAVPERVWKNFRGYFANAENPKWYMANKDYLVKFMTDEKLNHALFTKRGSLVYHISYGYEKSLPDDIRSQVRKAYLDYTITRAIKVMEADRVIWVINLEDNKRLILVRVEEGELEEVEKLDKT